jgi:hypothetical protein
MKLNIIRFFTILLAPFVIVGAAVIAAECVNGFIFMRSIEPRLIELFHACNPLEQMWVRVLYVAWAVGSLVLTATLSNNFDD